VIAMRAAVPPCMIAHSFFNRSWGTSRMDGLSIFLVDDLRPVEVA
jgi:hypothetical protein